MNQDIEQALLHIQADDRELWVKIGMAIKSELADGGFEIWDAWSQSSGSYKERDARAVWKSFKHGPVQIGTLFHIARENGYQSQRTEPTKEQEWEHVRRVRDRKQRELKQTAEPEWKDTAARARETVSLMTAAPTNHPYLVKKQIEPHGIGVLGCQFKYLPKPVRNRGNVLVIPKRNIADEVFSVEFIAEDGAKATLYGKSISGLMYRIGEVNGGALWIAEGFATAASLYQDEGGAVFVAFSAGNLKAVALELRMKYPSMQINFMADLDDAGLKKAKEAASAVAGVVYEPDGGKHGEDYNDTIRRQRSCR